MIVNLLHKHLFYQNYIFASSVIQSQCSESRQDITLTCYVSSVFMSRLSGILNGVVVPLSSYENDLGHT